MNQQEDTTSEDEPIMQKRVRDLNTGMVLAKPVYSSDGCTLLQADKVLTSRDISRLREWDKRFVYVKFQDNSEDEAKGPFAQAS